MSTETKVKVCNVCKQIVSPDLNDKHYKHIYIFHIFYHNYR